MLRQACYCLDMRTGTQGGSLTSQGCPVRLWQSWAQNFAYALLPHVRDLGLLGDFCKHRPLAHLETQAQTLQSWQRNSDHGTAPLDCVGKVRGGFLPQLPQKPGCWCPLLQIPQGAGR